MSNRPMRDIKQDFLLVDDLSSGTLKIEGQADAVLTDCVLSKPISLRELEPSGGYVTRRGTLFDWPKDQSSEPPLGSIFVDEFDTYWTIWKLSDRQHVGVYSAVCLNLNISTELFNEATLLKATYTKGLSNEASETWRGIVSGSTTPTDDDKVQARFQPSEETARLFFGADYTEHVFRITLKPATQFTLAGGSYRIVDSNGNHYRVMRYYQEERLDRLPVAIGVRVTEGEEFFGR